jgi:xanthine dehydrogenase YagT iron-sulfur-binding subunit
LSAEEIRERMSGNLCRCGAYVSIVQAVARAAETAQASQAPAPRQAVSA